MYLERYKQYGLKPHIGILPGWNWLEANEHKLDGWTPSIEMNLQGVKYNMTIKRPAVIRDIVRANAIKRR